MAFGDRLSELLEAKGISQREFSGVLNIAPTTLNGYIKNKRQPDFELVKNIAAALGVSVDYLLEYSGGAPVLNGRELALIERLRKLPPEQQSVIYDLVDTVYGRHKR